jgi:hypothetical protein
MRTEKNLKKPETTVHHHKPQEPIHAVTADAKSEIRSVPSVEKVSQHRYGPLRQGQVECNEGRKRNDRAKLNGLKATREMTQRSKKWKEYS